MFFRFVKQILTRLSKNCKNKLPAAGRNPCRFFLYVKKLASFKKLDKLMQINYNIVNLYELFGLR